ncbi:hypothetical protein J604_3952 [Acinetobacter sp. 694762]|nr:hypothetical protein ACINWC487_A0107 [Acinetobacter nosocomialis]EXI08629.1 hypothetical protein J604_3952 [Acinetobacter sp. 694762]
MPTKIYIRASIKDRDAERASDDLKNFGQSIKDETKKYIK